MAGSRFLSIALALLLFAGKANADTSVYVMGMAGTFCFQGDNYPNGPSWKSTAAGFTSGAFYTFLLASRFKPGFDFRAIYSPGYNGGRVYTGAMRISFVPESHPFRPYAQFGGGWASTELRLPVCTGSICGTESRDMTGAVAQLNVGLDIRVTRHLDIRAFDYARYTGGSLGLTHPGLRSFSAGVVFHSHRPGLSSP